MSYSYERQRRQTYGASTRRTAWGYWIPLAVTVTVATAGLVAWVWSERKDNEEEDLPPGAPPPGYGNAPPPATGYGPPPQGYGSPPSGSQGPLGFDGPPGQQPYAPRQPPYVPGPEGRGAEDESIVARMSGALRRTPSPQQILDGASRRVVAGVTAAGAAVGGALSSIREEDKTDYEDHSRWSEEADSHTGVATGRVGPEMRDLESSSSTTVRQAAYSGAKTGGKRKTVAIVVSAETDYEHNEDADYHQEHAVSLQCSFFLTSTGADNHTVNLITSARTYRHRVAHLRAHLCPRSQAAPSCWIAIWPNFLVHCILILKHRSRRCAESRREVS